MRVFVWLFVSVDVCACGCLCVWMFVRMDVCASGLVCVTGCVVHVLECMGLRIFLCAHAFQYDMATTWYVQGLD